MQTAFSRRMMMPGPRGRNTEHLMSTSRRPEILSCRRAAIVVRRLESSSPRENDLEVTIGIFPPRWPKVVHFRHHNRSLCSVRCSQPFPILQSTATPSNQSQRHVDRLELSVVENQQPTAQDPVVELNQSQNNNNHPPELSLSRSRVGPQSITDAIHLSPERKFEMLQLMEASERHVVNSMIGDEASLTLWKLRMRKKGITYYVDENVGKGLTRFCCVGVTDAPVMEIMKMFMVTNTEMLLKNVRIMYRNVQEAKILSVLKPATVDNPMQSVYIRYASFDTPILMSGRDICVCVCTNMFTLSDGSTVGYCLWDSVDIPECPDRLATDKIIRSKMWHSGFFFRNSGKPNAVTKVCYLIGVEIGGVVPQLLGHIHMTIFGGNCRRVCKHYRKRTLDPVTFTPRALWPPKSEIKDCCVCGKCFNPLVKKHYCIRCGKVVCGRGNCFFKEEVSVPGAVVTQVRICQYCLDETGMLKTNLQAIAARGNLNSLDSEGSGVRDLLHHNSESSRSL